MPTCLHTKAINTWALPVLIFSFEVLKYSEPDLEALDRLTHSLLTKFRFHHLVSAIEKEYLPRKEGGRGLMTIHQMCTKKQIITIVEAYNYHTPIKVFNGNMNISIRTTSEIKITWSEKVLNKIPVIKDNSVA